MLPWWRTLSSMQQDIKYVCFIHPGIWVGLHFIHLMVKWQNLSVWVFGSIFIQHKYSPAVLCEYQVLPGILLQITISLQVSWSVNAKQYVYIQCIFWGHQVQSSRKKSFANLPKNLSHNHSFHFNSVCSESCIWFIDFQNLSSYLHLPLQTVKYSFPVDDFYLLLKCFYVEIT